MLIQILKKEQQKQKEQQFMKSNASNGKSTTNQHRDLAASIGSESIQTITNSIATSRTNSAFETNSYQVKEGKNP